MSADSTYSGKSVIVTGSSTGIGAATAVKLAGRGANVTVCGLVAAEVQDAVGKCEKAAADAGHKGSRFLGVPGDMTDPACRAETVQKTVDAFGGLDVLVANHGMALLTPTMDDITESTFDRQLSITLKSVLFLIKEALPHLEKSRGCVVVTSALGSTIANTVHNVLYVVTKAALDHLVRCLALELAPKGIRLNTINPTFTETGFVNSDMSPLADEIFKFTAVSHPLGQRNGQPDDMAEAICFLGSDAARFVTGVCLKVDGGLSLKGNPISFLFQNTAAQQQQQG